MCFQELSELLFHCLIYQYQHLVPTGIKIGVRISPCSVVILPALALQSFDIEYSSNFIISFQQFLVKKIFYKSTYK